MKHTAKYEITHYPNSSYAYKIKRICSCGNTSTLSETQSGLTLRTARAAQRRHVAAAAKKATA
jgi:hypothetical protein